LVRSDREQGARSGWQFIEELIRGELDAVLARPRYGRGKTAGIRLSEQIFRIDKWSVCRG
jgi:hypothetical protein